MTGAWPVQPEWLLFPLEVLGCTGKDNGCISFCNLVSKGNYDVFAYSTKPCQALWWCYLWMVSLNVLSLCCLWCPRHTLLYFESYGGKTYTSVRISAVWVFGGMTVETVGFYYPFRFWTWKPNISLCWSQHCKAILAKPMFFSTCACMGLSGTVGGCGALVEGALSPGSWKASIQSIRVLQPRHALHPPLPCSSYPFRPLFIQFEPCYSCSNPQRGSPSSGCSLPSETVVLSSFRFL